MDSKVQRGGFKSPQETANFLSLLCFGLPLRTPPNVDTGKGGKKVLEIKDLYSPLKSDESKSLGDRLQREWVGELKKAERSLVLCKNEKKTKAERPSLTLAIARTFCFPQAMILGGEAAMSVERLQVIRVCALLRDFEELPHGDFSFVGERGASLSGGQRARVNLARAVYRDADLYLLDDPLSAVDARVGRHLFEECITGFLKDKTRILVTHQLQYLRQADTVLVVDRGTVKCEGMYDELPKSNFYTLSSAASDELDGDEHIGDHAENIKTGPSAESDDNIHGRWSESIVKRTDQATDITAEATATAEKSRQLHREYFSAGGTTCVSVLLVAAFAFAQIAASGTDYWVTYWTNQDIMRVASQSNKSNDNRDTKTANQGAASQWVDEFGLLSPYVAVYVYTFVVVGCVIIISMRNILFVKICMNSSRRIHESMFSNLLQATLMFFNNNPSGRILNRFSKDMGALDELLPPAMLDMLQTCSMIIGVIVMVVVVNYWMIIPAIAHRLNTIMDSDCVLVMGAGHALEFDHPHLLLENRESHFSQMLQQTGKVMAEKLAEMAKTAFLLSPEFGPESNTETVTTIVADDNHKSITYYD